MAEALTIDVGQGRIGEAARAVAYSCFSRLFSYPTDAVRDWMVESAADELAWVAENLPYDSSLRVRRFPVLPASAEAIQAEYCRLFEVSRPRGTAVSLHEKDYVTCERGEVWEDILRFYEHFGLNYSRDDCQEFPDHLAVELEFANYLSFLAAGAQGDCAAYERARADFVQRHLSHFVSALGEKLSGEGDADLYGPFCAMLRAFLSDEERTNA